MQAQFYIPKKNEANWEKFKSLHESASARLNELIEQDVETHQNPKK